MKNCQLLPLLIAFCCCLSAYQTMAQCGENPIQGFEVTQIEATTDGAANGTITVRVTGGEAPFIYTLFADFGGKGKEVVQISGATDTRTFTFRSVAATTKVGAMGYVVAVQSSNQSEGNMPEAICRKRVVNNLEVQ